MLELENSGFTMFYGEDSSGNLYDKIGRYKDAQGNLHKDTKDNIVAAVLPRLAKYLIYYSFHKAGNTYSPASMIFEAPLEVLTSLETKPGEYY